MPKQTLALALCRVSSTEQLENNSLNRQREAVLKAAAELNVKIPDDGWWSGSVSSKRGTNVGRKDLNEIISRCKKDRSIGYLIVDEPDRFMRSIDEAAFFEVTFKELGVVVWYASDPELNKGDLASKLLKFTKYLSAEGSNEERQHKSISGQTKAISEGRWPFHPKPGYKRGYERGVPEIHPIRGPALRKVLVRLATKQVSPTHALIELNNSDFMTGHSKYKMDKFRNIVTDSFYAGVVEINKQICAKNENGRHEPLITLEQHKELVRIMDRNPKNQSGPRKQGNPKYPGNNITLCDSCLKERNGRFVGFDHTNGHSSNLYERYRCRACSRTILREEIHAGIEKQFIDNPITEDGTKDFIEALKIVWGRQAQQTEQELNRISHKIKYLQESISNQVEAATDPSNVSIKEDILEAIDSKKSQITSLEEDLDKLNHQARSDEERFLRFAFNFADSMGRHFLDTSISQENRLRCKQIMFPSGFYVDKNKKVYTPDISPLITLVVTKRDPFRSPNSRMVRVMGL